MHSVIYNLLPFLSVTLAATLKVQYYYDGGCSDYGRRERQEPYAET